MSNSGEQHSNPAQKRYPPELRERAVRMVLDTIEETGPRQGVIGRIARQLGVGTESPPLLGEPGRGRRQTSSWVTHRGAPAAGGSRAREQGAPAGQRHFEVGPRFLRGGARPSPSSTTTRRSSGSSRSVMSYSSPPPRTTTTRPVPPRAGR